MDLLAGQMLGDYQVLGRLGSGGMGTVYKVRSTITQRIEAIKIVLSSLDNNAELAERFLREIRISAGLDHPNIACLRAAQRTNDQLLMVMEYVEGSTLSELMQESRLPLNLTLSYISQSLAALDYAHAHGVIHRDIKPGNIMVTPSGQVKLMDFGVAKLATDSKLTKTGLLVGSLHYMAPEQIEGGELSARSDLYSLGVTFYEMVTGTRPFNGDSEFQIMAAHLKGAPPPPCQLDPALPASINEIILTAMARDPKQRFGSAKAMKAAVDSVLQQGAATTFSGALKPAQPKRVAAAMPVAPAAKPVGKSHRTAYMLAGSLATLAVLILAAIEIPNFRHASAHSQNPAAQTPPVQTPPVQTVSAPPSSSPQQPIANPDAPPAVQPPTQQETPHPPGAQSVVPKHQPITPPAIESQELKPSRSSSGAPGTATQPPPPPSSPPVNTAAVEELRERKAQLDGRIVSVRTSLDGLRSQQAAQGLTLRGDMTAAEQRLFYLMTESEKSLQAGDAAQAAKRLDAAETELTKLENFLGR